TFPPLQTLDARPTNLPAPATPLIGREQELAAATALVQRADVRLVTLTGPGGIGKTRLSLQIAATLRDEYADGTWLVELAGIRDPALVGSSIAQALGVREVAGESLPTTLQAYLRSRTLLLVLDNFEHVLDAAPLVADLLAAAPGLQVLTSSREGLDLYGEHEFAVPPLALPDPGRLPGVEQLTQYAAVRLFVDRVVARDAGFAVTPATTAVVAEICLRLDGLPLAIELAATRCSQLGVEGLRAQLSARLGVLVGGPRNHTARQQSLRGAIAWSYDLLAPTDQQVFRQLGVFVGAWTLAAATAVVALPSEPDPAPAGRAALGRLVDKSLLRQGTAPDGESSYQMLETIHEYAREQLATRGELDTVRQQHAAYYLALAEQAEPELTGPQQRAWLNRLEDAHGNFRAALAWALEQGQAELALRLGGALRRLWDKHGHLSEGRRWLVAALALDRQAAPAARAKALNGAGSLARMQGDYPAARAFHEECLQVRRALGDRPGVAASLHNLGLLAQEQGDYPTAQRLLEESLADWRALGDSWGIASPLAVLGSIAAALGDYPRARGLLEESLALFRALDDQSNIADRLNSLGWVALYQGDGPAARRWYGESLALVQELGDKIATAHCLEGLSLVAVLQGDPTRAAWLAGAAGALRQAIDSQMPLVDRPHYEQGLARARASVDADAWASAWAAGAALALDDVLAATRRWAL
ncbi:MAG TPA: tetratricopeptide repeat protein, partial [Chloroflexia bacterium]|nr:tetratricopeptide repeat protein [Chloroflexia bacterium]